MTNDERCQKLDQIESLLREVHLLSEPSDEMYCLMCDKSITVGAPGGLRHWPMTTDGLVVHMAGNYGSSILDMDRGYFRAVICDDCVKARSHKIQYIEHEHFNFEAVTDKRSALEWITKSGNQTEMALRNLASIDSGLPKDTDS